MNGQSSTNLFSPPGFLNATNITNLVAISSTKKLTLSVRGNQVAAYLDGSLIVQGRTSNLSGTKVGFVVDSDSSSPFVTFDNFEVKAVSSDLVAPSAVRTISISEAGPTNAFPTVSWSQVFDDTSNIQLYKIYRSEVLGSLGDLVGTSNSLSFLDNTLNLPGTYYYTVRAQDSCSNESQSEDNIQTSSFEFDNEAPTGSIQINSGNSSTNSLNVTLTISATDNRGSVTEMIISEDPSFTGASYVPFATSKAFVLSSSQGNKTVYIRFKDDLGNISSAYFDEIVYSVSHQPSNNQNTQSNSQTTNQNSSSTVAEENSVVEEPQEESVEQPVNEMVNTYFKLKLTDANGAALVGVKVFIKDLNIQAITDSNGQLDIGRVKAGSYVTKVTIEGKTYEATLIVPSKDKVLGSTITLKLDTEENTTTSNSDNLLKALAISLGVLGIGAVGVVIYRRNKT